MMHLMKLSTYCIYDCTALLTLTVLVYIVIVFNEN